MIDAVPLRIALGCMRLSTQDDRDEARGLATLRAALDAGVTTFDTARAYAWNDGELGHNERLLARAIAESGRSSIRIVTKGGMRRPGGLWEPDGRARAIREDCLGSLQALGGLPVDLYLLHAPDPKVSWAVSVRALARLLDEGKVRRIGVCNVTRRQLDEALTLAPIAAVQIALGPFAEGALRGGVVARCIELGIEVLAHSPLGGPAKAARLTRQKELCAIAERHSVTPQRVALAAIAGIHSAVVPVVGARRPETIKDVTAALALDDDERALLDERYGWRALLAPPAPVATSDREVVLLMGLQGSGKSSAASAWVSRGYARLCRDEQGGTLKSLHRALGERLAAGERAFVLDNTYTTRASRQGAIEVARRHGASVVGVWLETSLPDATRNVIGRMLRVHGRLLEPEEMERARDPSALPPHALARTERELEVPAADEGFSSLEVVAFRRSPRPGHERTAELIALEAAEQGARPGGELALVFGWRPGADPAWVAAREPIFGASVRVCSHPGGPPRCWCRPPLPGLLLEFAEKNGVDLARCTVVGTKPIHAAMARAVGATYRAVGP